MIIFFTAMVATAVVLVAFFVHFTVRELGSLNAASIPLPTLSAQDKQELNDSLHGATNNTSAAPAKQDVNAATPATPVAPAVPSDQSQQPTNTQNPSLEIPAKAMQ